MAALSSRASAPHGNHARKNASVPDCTAARQNCQSSSPWIQALQRLLIYIRDCGVSRSRSSIWAATWKKRRLRDARNPARRKRRAARRRRTWRWRKRISARRESRTSWRSTVWTTHTYISLLSYISVMTRADAALVFTGQTTLTSSDNNDLFSVICPFITGPLLFWCVQSQRRWT